MLRLQTSPSKSDGSFVLSVPAGRYVLTARGANAQMSLPGSTVHRQFAQTDVAVTGLDVENLVLRLEEGATISGTVTPRPDLRQLWIGAFPETADPAAVPAITALVREDGTFTISGVSPGRVSLRTTSGGGSTWWIEQTIVDGRNVTEEPLELRAGQLVSGVAISITDRRTELTCTVQDSAGAPVTTYTLAIVPADPALRRLGSPRMPKPGRPSAKDGGYTVTGLPPGDYLIFALSDHDDDAWAAGIRPDLDPASAVKVSLGSGEKKAVAVRVRPEAHGARPK
jgi:hypothetical protein